MAISAAGNFEVSDNDGSTIVYSATATTTPANVPASPIGVISGFLVDNTGANEMQVSMDGGTTFKTIAKREFLSWNVKGCITQLVVKTPSATTTYEIIINHEES